MAYALLKRVLPVMSTSRPPTTNQSHSSGASTFRARDYLGVVVHDIKNPLGAALGNLGFMRDTLSGASEDVIEAIEDVDDAVRRVSALVDELLTISVFEDGKLGLRLETFDVGELLSEVERDARREANLRNISLTLEPTTKLTLRADRGLVRRMVDNMIACAFRETVSGGSVVLRATKETTIEVTRSGAAAPTPASMNPRIYFTHCVATAHGGVLRSVPTERANTLVVAFPR